MADLSHRFIPAAEKRPVLGWIGRIWRSLKNRREAAVLATLDDHALADIGLTRGDVMAAFSGSLADDPTIRLARLAGERRMARRGHLAAC